MVIDFSPATHEFFGVEMRVYRFMVSGTLTIPPMFAHFDSSSNLVRPIYKELYFLMVT
jgi:hypothetical protein